jgi:hypothetical protein
MILRGLGSNIRPYIQAARAEKTLTTSAMLNAEASTGAAKSPTLVMQIIVRRDLQTVRLSPRVHGKPQIGLICRSTIGQ